MEKRKKRIVSRLLLIGAFCSVLVMTMSVVDAQAHRTLSALTDRPSSKLNIPSVTDSLSFNFQDISVRAFLQLIAQQTKRNFIISESVKGSVGFSLFDVTWEEALAAIMRSQNLDSREYGNVLMIAPIEELAASDLKRSQARQELLNLAPPLSEIIPMHYANAIDLSNVIKSQQGNLLSKNGELGVDPRTNSIWIRDNRLSLARAREFIKRFDIPVKQVIIEARIVSIDKKYAEELGIKWGVSDTKNLSGTLPGANAINKGTPLSDVPIDQRLNFNTPAQSAGVFGATPSTVGLALQRIGNIYLDLELSALEGEQHAQIISNPRVITANLQKAYIQTGEEIPYQESTSSGATSVAFIKAVLSLEITPQVTKDNNVMLSVKVTQNKRGTSVTTGSGGVIPSIDTEELSSFVQLKSDETIVIGGVYKKTERNNVERIPFLGSLPMIGGLFRHTHVDLDRSELLIFITPKVVNQSSIATLNENEKQLNRVGLEVSRGFPVLPTPGPKTPKPKTPDPVVLESALPAPKEST